MSKSEQLEILGSYKTVHSPEVYKELNDAKENPKCTPGHEAQCENATSHDCHCNCGGANHGTKKERKQ